jgi:hypothetical protein
VPQVNLTLFTIMEILVEIGVLPRDKVNFLMNEADQLVAIIVSSINTARNGKKEKSEYIKFFIPVAD